MTTLQEKKSRLLKAYAVNQREIERLTVELDRLQHRMDSLREVPEVYKNLAKAPPEFWDRRNLPDAILKLRAFLYDQLSERLTFRCAAEEVIASVTEPRFRLLLTLRYIDALLWEDIADKMAYDVHWLHRLHRKALDSVDIAKLETTQGAAFLQCEALLCRKM